MSTPERPRFEAFALSSVLTDGSWLVLDRRNNVLLQLSSSCTVVELQVLSDRELFFIERLFANHPKFCPDSELVAVVGRISLEDARRRVNAALDIDASAYDGLMRPVRGLMRPVRGLMSRVRAKVRPFGVEVKAVLETGYMLIPYRSAYGRAS